MQKLNANFNARFKLGKKKVADLLIKSGADVIAVDDTGKSALHLAAQHGKDKVIELLINSGLPVDTMDKSGRTPLHIAAKHGKRTKCLIHGNPSRTFVRQK